MPGAPKRLRCEYLDSPIGIDERQPRLSWWLDDERPAEVQTAYHMIAARRPESLEADSGDLWDSGRVESSSTCQIPYGGRPLTSRQRVWWKVRAFDSDGIGSPWSRATYFEAGLLDREDWRARWIGAALMGGKRTPAQVPALRRSFEVTRPILSARLYITALGVYDVEINGTRAIDVELAPGWTDYHKRVYYQTFDVTRLLHTRRKRHRRVARRRLVLRRVRCRGSSTIRRPAVVVGATRDCARRWLGAARRHRRSVEVAPFVDPVLGHSARRKRRRAPVSRRMDGARLRRRALDAGERDAGTPRHRARIEPEPAGADHRSTCAHRRAESPQRRVRRATADLRLRPEHRRPCTRDDPSAAWNADADPSRRTSRRTSANSIPRTFASAAATDLYTCCNRRGRHIRAALHVSWLSIRRDQRHFGESAIEDVIGIVLASALPRIGEFVCDHALLNQLQSNIPGASAAIRRLPTDCPQRDERLGWTGDAQVFVRSAAFNLDVAAFFTKWLVDLTDAQSARRNRSAARAGPARPRRAALGERARTGPPGWRTGLGRCNRDLSVDDLSVLRRQTHARAPLRCDEAFIDNIESRFPALIRGDVAVEAVAGFRRLACHRRRARPAMHGSATHRRT